MRDAALIHSLCLTNMQIEKWVHFFLSSEKKIRWINTIDRQGIFEVLFLLQPIVMTPTSPFLSFPSVAKFNSPLLVSVAHSGWVESKTVADDSSVLRMRLLKVLLLAGWDRVMMMDRNHGSRVLTLRRGGRRRWSEYRGSVSEKSELKRSW